MIVDGNTTSQLTTDPRSVTLKIGSFSQPDEKVSETCTIETPTSSASSSPSWSPSPSPKLPYLTLLSSSFSSSSEQDLNSWVAPASQKSVRTQNPIRAIVDPIMSSSVKSGKERGDGKDQISLALGDPTAFGNIPPCPTIVQAITTALHSPGMAAGYVPACGTIEARTAIATHHSNECGNDYPTVMVPRITPDDVIVASGASGALELAITALLDEDTVLLVPRPGFPLYQVIAESHGARVAHYNLLPDHGWECDLDHIESLIIDEELPNNSDRDGLCKKHVVRGIVINNPSNPTGAVYSEEHLIRIAQLAEKYRLPIISDEIYGDMTLDGHTFHPMAKIVGRMGYCVPVITASGIGKQYLVPGWRVGWIVFQDSYHGAIQEVKKGAQRLAQIVLGACHLAQLAIPAVLSPKESDRIATLNWKAEFHSTVQNQALLLCSLLNECIGLDVICPQGAMYCMVKIDVEKFDDLIVDDVSFMKLLLEEENIVVLPGTAFGLCKDACPVGQDKDRRPKSFCHAFRVVYCAPERTLRVAAERISFFCLRHCRSICNT